MNYTTNYNLNKPEGTDLYNHLTIDNPNMDTIDAAMYANKLQAVGNATELVSGTVHALTRSDANQNIFKFKATGNFNAGDTIAVDGTTVNAYTTSGHQLPDNAYVLSAVVLCFLDGTNLWLIVDDVQDASEVPWDNSGTDLSANNVQALGNQLYTTKVTMNTETTPNPIALNGTYQISNAFLNKYRTFMIIARRYGAAGSCIVTRTGILSGLYNASLALPATQNSSYTISIDTSGIITLTGNGNGALGDPNLDIIGLS